MTEQDPKTRNDAASVGMSRPRFRPAGVFGRFEDASGRTHFAGRGGDHLGMTRASAAALTAEGEDLAREIEAAGGRLSAIVTLGFAPPPEEALKYNPNHWPAGAPDSRGGQFAPGDAVAEQDAGVDPNRFNTPPKGWRYLTDCETRMAKAIFGNSIDYSAVKIHREKYSIGQSDDETVTPNGQMYLSPKNKGYADDYCSTGPDSRAHFIHEMTHVWQYQHGINVVWRRALGTAGITNDAAYDYHLEAGKPLSEYGIEQQAAIVQDYFRLSTGQAVSDRAKNDPKPTLDEYWRTIQPIREKKPTRS